MATIDLGEIGGTDEILDFSTPAKRPTPPPTPPAPKKKTPGWRDALAAVGGGMYGAGLGLAQLATETADIIPGVDLSNTANRLRGAELERQQVMNALAGEYEGTGIANPIRRLGFWGEVLPGAAALPEVGAGMVFKAPTLVGKAGRAAVAGGAAGSAQPLSPEESRLLSTGVGATFGAALPATGAAMQKGYKAAKAASKYTPLEEVVEYNIAKIAKPSFTNQQTPAQRKAYYKDAVTAVQEIVKAKDEGKLLLPTEDGVGVRLPKSISEFADSIATTKKALYDQYNTMAQEAGGAGVRVDLSGTIDLINKELGKKINKTNPQFQSYGKQMVEILEEAQNYTPSEAQDLISQFNNSLKTFYNNPSKQTQGEAAVDALIAGSLRENLEKVISKYSGPGYQDLKRLYGSLSRIEKDVNRQVAVNSRKAGAGFFDISDTYAAQHAAMALMKMDPVGLAAAGSAHGVKRFLKFINDPNRLVQNMFEKVDRRMVRPKAPAAPPIDEVQKLLPPGQGFTTKAYAPDEVLPPQGPGVIPLERRLYGPTVDAQPTGVALPSPGQTSDVSPIAAGWTPTLNMGRVDKGTFYMEGPQGKTSVNIRDARAKLKELGFSSEEVDGFINSIMRR